MSYDNEDIIRTYVESMTPVFRMLRLHAGDDERLLEKIKTDEESIVSIKKMVINNFLKYSIKKRCPSEKQKENLLSAWKKSTDILHGLIAELSEFSNEHKYVYEHIDLSEMYNNQAFEEVIRDDSKADITGEGTHYLMDECVIVNGVWKKSTFEFIYKYKAGENDNISCCGQEISLGRDIPAESISILGCAEYGSFNEKIELIYSDGTNYAVSADFSDFFQPAAFGETTFWSGIALDRKKGRTAVHNFNARIFAKRYVVPSGNIKALRLPERKNVHIFAVAAERQLFTDRE